MKLVWKVKRPGQPVKTYYSYIGCPAEKSFAKQEPLLYAQVKPSGAQRLKLGEKRKVRIPHKGGKPAYPFHRKAKTGRKIQDGWFVAVHHVHPREMSVKARKKVVGAGLAGKARRLFIEEGMTYKEQQAAVQLQVAESTQAAIDRYRAEHPEEYRSRKRKQRERTTQRRKERGGIDYSKYYSPDKIGKAAGLTGAEVRKFLRKKKIGKRGGRYAFTKKEAIRVARAAKKYYDEEG